MGKVRACCTAKFKLEVVWYTQEHGIRAVGRKSDADQTMYDNGQVKKKKLKELLKRNVYFVIRSVSIHMWKPNYISML
jgi:hypothetical protein